jgi:hypothetical protein
MSALAGALVVALIGACGDDDASSPTADAPDPERYCQVAEDLDAAGAAIFEELEANPDATPEDFAEAERELVEGNAELLEELETAAPQEIEGDVAELLAGLRARAGLSEEGPTQKDLSEAEKAVNAYEKEACKAG